MKLAFKSVDSVKWFFLSNVDEPHLFQWGTKLEKKEKKNKKRKSRGRKNSALSAWLIELEPGFSPALGIPDAQISRLGLNYTTGFSESPAWRWQVIELLSFHNCIGKFLLINLFSYIYTCNKCNKYIYTCNKFITYIHVINLYIGIIIFSHIYTHTCPKTLQLLGLIQLSSFVFYTYSQGDHTYSN